MFKRGLFIETLIPQLLVNCYVCSIIFASKISRVTALLWHPVGKPPEHSIIFGRLSGKMDSEILSKIANGAFLSADDYAGALP